MIGQTLSHFKITAKLGEGGMGEVYRAEDTKLGREVAIKVLPEAVSQDAERLARFEREAKVLASLNHTNIAAIYQVERDGDVHFLVLELVEGDDLKQRLARGPMELEDVLSAGVQVAEALEAAHDKGVVHRDLKPANVKVTPDGHVKVLDFGLAKALDSSADPDGESRVGATNFSMSPTLTAQMTEAGVILGTAAYMSPEQARGRLVDKRADVWAFGVLLWEMLTARLLFDGETVADVIASVVTKEPDPALLPDATPPEVERLLARCLRKDPNRRLPDIGAARVVLQDVVTGTTPEVRAPETSADRFPGEGSGHHSRKRWLWAMGALVAAGAVAGAVLIGLTRKADVQQTVHFATAAPEGWTFDWGGDSPLPSPDGDRVVFRVSPDTPQNDAESTLWIRSLASLTALPLGGTEGTSRGGPIAWSPDGDSILFRAQDDVRVLDLVNGTARSLAKIPVQNWSEASWNHSGTILYSSGGNESLIYSVPASGGTPTPLTSLDATRQEAGHFFPEFLPDGNRFLFMAYAGEQSENTGLFLASLDDPTRRQRVVESSEWIRRSYASGHLLFVDQATLFAQPFDLDKGLATGTPVALVSPVANAPGFSGLGRFGTSASGNLAYLPGQGSSGVQLQWRDREGEDLGTVGEPADYGQIALSPDGRSIALEIRDEEGQFDLWVMEVARGVLSRVTATPENERDPVWSPDGRYIAYFERGSEGALLVRKGIRTRDSEEVLMDATEEYIPESWSTDGRTIMVVQRTQDDRQSIWALEDGEDPRRFPTPTFRVDEPQLSPDGKWLAYVSPESDRQEVYVESFRQEGERVRVSLHGGGQPKWGGDSRELFFVTREGMLAAVEIAGEDGRAEVGLPQELFRMDLLEGPGYDDYAVDAAGERFLIRTAVGRVEPQLQIVTNWTGLLE